MITGLDHVLLAAPPGTEPALRAYYGDLLGMTEIPKPPALAARGGCWFEAGTAQLHLGADPDHRAARKAHPAFTVTDIDALAARLTAAERPRRVGPRPPGPPPLPLDRPGGKPTGVPGGHRGRRRALSRCAALPVGPGRTAQPGSRGGGAPPSRHRGTSRTPVREITTR